MAMVSSSGCKQEDLTGQESTGVKIHMRSHYVSGLQGSRPKIISSIFELHMIASIRHEHEPGTLVN